MLKSRDTVEFLEDNPGSAVKKAFLHTSSKVEKSLEESWLKRIVKENVIKTQNEK